MSSMREQIKKEVVDGLDFISPIDLSRFDAVSVEALRIDFTMGFDESMKRALNVPLTRLARKYGGVDSRPISSAETTGLKTIGGAIDLTVAAADGKVFPGE